MNAIQHAANAAGAGFDAPFGWPQKIADGTVTERRPARRWQDRFVDRVQTLCEMDNHCVAMFVVELMGLIEIDEIYGHGVKQSLMHEALVSLSARFGTHGVCCLGEYRLAVVVDSPHGIDLPGVAACIQADVEECESACGVRLVGVHPIGMAQHGPIGGRSLQVPSGECAAELIRRAELALHHTSQCRSKWVRYTPDLHAQLRHATQLRQSLMRAIDRQEFTLAYQPIVDLRSRQTSGFEALLRWNAPEGEHHAGPGEFIPEAEETGLIVPIGRQVMAHALRQVREWTQAGHRPTRVAVNVSGLQLRERDFFETVSDLMAKEGVQPQALELELTERSLIESSPATIALLEHFRQIGIVISVDDFGTSYSSLRYLQELPISKLKIDRGFVSRLSEGPREEAMVRTMIQLAESFALDVVAEGIETPLQLATLRRHGCAGGQGFLFSRAVAPDAACRLLDKKWQ